MVPTTQKSEAGPALVQLGDFISGRLEKELHEGVHLVFRAGPVLGRERVERERLYAGPAGGLEEGCQDGDAGPMPGGSREPASLGPAAVAVHDDGYVARGARKVEAG